MSYTVISTNQCSWCKKARELLDSRGNGYVGIDVSNIHYNAAMRTLVKMAGFTTVPQVFAPDGTHIGGYEDLVKHLEEEDEKLSDNSFDDSSYTGPSSG